MSRRQDRKRALRAISGLAMGIAMLAGGDGAGAQTTQDSAPADQASPAVAPPPVVAPEPGLAPGADAAAQSDREIVVTGTAIKGVAPVGSATVTMDRAALVASGIRDTAQLISSLPQGSNLGTSQNSTGGRQQGVNLRGLGNNATLLLFDGHRWVPQGVISQVSDPSIIPFGAIERVEVVTDGASAIYGSDAVAGVVNYVLRKDYEGLELTGRLTDTLYQQKTLEGVLGHRWSEGGMMVAFSYSAQGSVPRSARDYLRQDLRPYGGNDNRLVGTSVYPGVNGALIIGNTVYGLPATNGAVPTAAQVLALKGNPQLADTADLYDYFASRKQLSVLAKAHQSLGEQTELSLTANFNRRENEARAQEALPQISINLTPSSPWYIPGLTSGNETFVYNLGLNYANAGLIQKNTEDTFNSTAELTTRVRGFDWDTYASYGLSIGCNVCQAQANTTVAAVIANTPSYYSTFDPYLPGMQSGANMLIGGFLQQATFRTLDAGTKLSGAMFELPGGAAKIAVGGELTKYWFSLLAQNKLNLQDVYQVSRSTSSDRLVTSAYAEVYLPVVGPAQALPALQRLDLSGAVRWDRYSDFGHTVNPKFGLTWQPAQGVKLRASWGTSFRAPTLIEDNPATVGQTNRIYIANGANDPSVPVTLASTGQSAVLNRTGNTAGLKPETATVWSLGADVTPLRGLKLGVTYYNVNYKNRIENLSNQTATNALVLSNPANRALYSNYFIVAPQPSTCVNGNYATYNPAYLPFLTDKNAVFTPSTINDCTLTGIVNGGLQNLGNVKQSGLDFTLNYRLETGAGTFMLDSSFSKILNLQKSLTANGPLFDALDTYGFQVSARGRGTLSWMKDGASASVTANYVGSYLNNATITVNGVTLPNTMVPAWTTFDAHLGYEFGEGRGVLSGTRIGLNVQNLADRAPPIVLSGTNAIDTNNANIWGRIWTVEVTHKF
jgi:iron complex outermembrane recepter protein